VLTAFLIIVCLLPALIYVGGFSLGVFLWIKVIKKREFSLPQALLAGALNLGALILIYLMVAQGLHRLMVEHPRYLPAVFNLSALLLYLPSSYWITGRALKLCWKGTLPPWLLGHFTVGLILIGYGAILRLMK